MSAEAAQHHVAPTTTHGPPGPGGARFSPASPSASIAPERAVRRELGELQRQLVDCKESIAYLKGAGSGDRKNGLEMPPVQATKAYNSLELYEMLVNECVRDVVFASHREAKLEKAVCQICDTNCDDYVSAPALDIFGNSPTETEQFPCENCGSMQTSSRYAPHLEKCMGLCSRGPGRAARHRPSGPAAGGSLSPYVLSDDKDVSSDYADSDDKEWSNSEGKKRKRAAGDSDDKDWSTSDGKKRKKMPKMPAIKIKKPSAPDTPNAPAATTTSANPVGP